jgi:hypothetical protein
LAISKISRRNKEIIKHVEITTPISTKQAIINNLADAEDGLTFGEIYEKFPHLAQRGLREHIQNLKQNDMLVMKTCRCHSATVYYLRTK